MPNRLFARLLPLCLVLVLSVAAPVVSHAQSAERATVYVWGNSLFHHLTNNDDTTVPHWLSRLARAGDRKLELDGQWGFVRDFAQNLPPQPNWSFKEVKSAWNSERIGFDRAGFDTVILNPANFIQYQTPDAAYDGPNPTGASPVSATVEVFDWVRQQGVEPVFFLYEGWQELGQFPPTRRKFRRYLSAAQGDYAEWYRDYHAAVAAALPGADVRLIPVSSILAGLVQDGPLSDLRPVDLYSDDAPHGTASTYFLAALVTYAAIYNAPPPVDFVDFGTLDGRLRDAYPEIVAHIWEAIQDDLAPREAAAVQPETPQQETIVETAQVAPKDSAVAEDAPRPQVEAPAAAPPRVALPSEADTQAAGLTNPSLAMGLNGIADWSTQHPFIDLMKTARPWTGHTTTEWGAVSEADLRAGGHLDPDGWPLSIPDGVVQIEAFLLTDQPAEAQSLDARYRLTWEGKGAISVGGVARMREYSEGEMWFTYRPAEGVVSVSIQSVDPSDPIRDIAIVREDHVPLFEAGVIYNPAFVARIADLRSLRFMDWTFTNGSTKQSWADRARPTHYTFVEHGVPVEHIIHLSNLIGADPWVNMPHMADDDFMRRYALAMRDGLDPRLKVYVEYSNEVWNFIFPQAVHAREQAIARWGERAGDDAWMQWAGMRAAQMSDIWAEVFAGQEDRMIPTVGVHSGWLGLEEPLLEAPLWVAEGNARPADRFLAYAVTGYFGYELGGDAHAPQIIGWIDAAEAAARAKGEAQGLRRVALREFVEAAGLAPVYGPTAQLLRDSSIPELVDTIWPYHAGVAGRYGMQMVMYEGGSHVAPHGEWSSDDRLSRYFQDFNYSPEMAAIYADLLTAWRAAGGTLYNAFVDIAPPSQYGSWGALRHIDDATARWDALMAFNTAQTAWWETRRADAFVHGVTRIGGPGADQLDGTTEEDILIGGPGDDTLITRGRADHLHGGPGQDRAVLPGALADYDFATDGARLLARGVHGVVTLVAVEFLRFDDVEIATASLL